MAISEGQQSHMILTLIHRNRLAAVGRDLAVSQLKINTLSEAWIKGDFLNTSPLAIIQIY
jgi:hypothetical protein